MEDPTMIAGAILDETTISERDYILGGDSPLSVKIKLAYNSNKTFIELNQSFEEWAWWTCTICSAFTMLNYNTNQNYSMSDVKIVMTRMQADGKFGLKSGAKLVDAIDYVRKYNNEVSSIKVDSFRLDIGSDEHYEAGANNLAIQYGFFTSSEFQNDAQDNGIVSGVNFPHSGGHAVTDLNVSLTTDNYKTRKKYNQYRLADMVKLKDNGVVYPSGYLFLKQEYSMFEDVSINSPFYPAIKKMHDLGLMVGQDGKFRPKDNITREELAIVITRLTELVGK